MDKESVSDLLSFLSKDAPSMEVRVRASDYLAGLTGTEVGRRFLSTSCSPHITPILADLLQENNVDLRNNALLSVVNMSADQKSCSLLADDRIINCLLHFTISPPQNKLEYAENSIMGLSNLAHWEMGSLRIMNYLQSQKAPLLENLLNKFFITNDSMHYFASFLGNLTQIKEARLFILNKDKPYFTKLLSYISFKESYVRQKGVISAIKNCCFETDSHLWMLGEKVNILPALLLPIAGPEEFDDEDTDKLPMELQYLGGDKKRDPNPEIREMLVESVNQLCATKAGRDIVKANNAYAIFREYHKWEKNDDCIIAIENVVSVLISDEPEKGMENLNEVKIPKDVEKKMNNVK